MWLNLTLNIFHQEAEEKEKVGGSKNPCWLGIKLGEGQVQKPERVRREVMGLLIWPMLIPGTRWEAALGPLNYGR